MEYVTAERGELGEQAMSLCEIKIVMNPQLFPVRKDSGRQFDPPPAPAEEEPKSMLRRLADRFR